MASHLNLRSQFLQSQKFAKIVRKTKTSTTSRISDKGEIVEKTTVTIVTETITHARNVVEDDEDSTDKAASSYFDCIESCETSTENGLTESKGFLETSTSTNKTETESPNVSHEPSTLDMSEELHSIEENPTPPHTQLSTGLPCCMSRLVTSSTRSWTFYLSGLIRNIPLYCTDR